MIMSSFFLLTFHPNEIRIWCFAVRLWENIFPLIRVENSNDGSFVCACSSSFSSFFLFFIFWMQNIDNNSRRNNKNWNRNWNGTNTSFIAFLIEFMWWCVCVWVWVYRTFSLKRELFVFNIHLFSSRALLCSYLLKRHFEAKWRV